MSISHKWSSTFSPKNETFWGIRSIANQFLLAHLGGWLPAFFFVTLSALIAMWMEKRPLWQQQLLQVIFVYLILLDQIRRQRDLFIIFFIGWHTNVDELISNGFFSMISMSSISIIKQYILHRHDCSVWSCHPQLLFRSLTYFLPLQLTFLSVLGKTGLSNSRWLDWGPITFHFLLNCL